MTDLNVPTTFVSGTSIVAADMNANFDAIETLVNTTGVPKVQDATVGAAQLASGSITPPKMAAPDILRYYMSATVAFTGTGTFTLTGSTRTWTSDLAPVYSTYVGWDATNKRPYAKIAGLYRVKSKARMIGSNGSAVQFIVDLRLKVNGATEIDRATFRTDSATAFDSPFVCEKVVSLAVNDYLQPDAVVSAGTFGISGGVMATTYDTWIEMEYIGPAS